MQKRDREFYCPVFEAMTVDELVVCLIPPPTFVGNNTMVCYTCNEVLQLGTKPNCAECAEAWRYIDGRRRTLPTMR